MKDCVVVRPVWGIHLQPGLREHCRSQGALQKVEARAALCRAACWGDVAVAALMRSRWLEKSVYFSLGCGCWRRALLSVDGPTSTSMQTELINSVGYEKE